jgi:hypothetical protein
LPLLTNRNLFVSEGQCAFKFSLTWSSVALFRKLLWPGHVIWLWISFYFVILFYKSTKLAEFISYSYRQKETEGLLSYQDPTCSVWCKHTIPKSNLKKCFTMELINYQNNIAPTKSFCIRNIFVYKFLQVYFISYSVVRTSVSQTDKRVCMYVCLFVNMFVL